MLPLLHNRTCSARGSPAELVGEFCFETPSHQLLAVDCVEGVLRLLPPRAPLDRSAVFRCYRKESHLYALECIKTLKFITVGFWGGIKVTGRHFGSSEQLYIDWSDPWSGIVSAVDIDI